MIEFFNFSENLEIVYLISKMKSTQIYTSNLRAGICINVERRFEINIIIITFTRSVENCIEKRQSKMLKKRRIISFTLLQK